MFTVASLIAKKPQPASQTQHPVATASSSGKALVDVLVAHSPMVQAFKAGQGALKAAAKLLQPPKNSARVDANVSPRLRAAQFR